MHSPATIPCRYSTRPLPQACLIPSLCCLPPSDQGGASPQMGLYAASALKGNGETPELLPLAKETVKKAWRLGELSGSISGVDGTVCSTTAIGAGSAAASRDRWLGEPAFSRPACGCRTAFPTGTAALRGADTAACRMASEEGTGAPELLAIGSVSARTTRKAEPGGKCAALSLNNSWTLFTWSPANAVDVPPHDNLCAL